MGNCVCSNVFNHLWASKFSTSEAKIAGRVTSVENGDASVTGVDKIKPGDINTVSERTLHTSRKSQYLYLYGTPNDLSGIRTPTEVDLKAYSLFLFRVVDEEGSCAQEPVVLDQGSLDKELSKGLLGWANKDPHRFVYGVQSETDENLLIVGDTISASSLVNGSSRTFKDISNDTFSGEYSLVPAAKSTTKVTFSNQTFPNKFIGDLGFDFEVWPHKKGAPVAREPLRSSDVSDSESFKKDMSSVLLQAFQKLAIAGVVGSVTTFGMSDVAHAMFPRPGIGFVEEGSRIDRILRNAPERSIVNDLAAQQEFARNSGVFTEEQLRESFGENYVPPNNAQERPAQTPVVESKHNPAPVNEGKMSSIPEEKASSPRNLLRPQGDEKVEPNDSFSVIPNEPDSPRQPDPIVQEPAQGANNDPQGQQAGNNQHPGDLSEILGNHEAAQGAADRARDRVRAGMSL